MKRMYAFVLIAAFSLLVLSILGLIVSSPHLYSVEDSQGSAKHYNPHAWTASHTQYSDEVLSCMAGLLNGTGTVVLTIRSGDLDAAERNLERLTRLSHSLDTLVINLEASEGDLKRFQEQTRQNIADLQDLINQSREFQELNRLEVRYREQNSSQVRSVAYEGEALHLRMEETYQRYSSRQPAVLDLSRQFGLDTQSYESGVAGFENITQAAQEQQMDRMANVGDTSNSHDLTAVVHPAVTEYAGILNISGVLGGGDSRAKSVDLFIDGENVGSARTDNRGHYSQVLRIGQTSAGRHLVYARYNETFSETAVFTLRPLPTVLDLSAALETVNGTPQTVCSGMLATTGTPAAAVAGAPIQILVDGNKSFQGQTEANGTFRIHVRLSPGDHTLVASFDGAGYPLHPAESAPIILTVPEPFPFTFLLVTAGSIVVFMACAVLYLRWAGRRAPPAPERSRPIPAHPPSLIAVTRGSAPVVLDPPMQAAVKGEVRKAVYQVYTGLLARLGAAYRIRRIRTHTPREVVRLLTGTAVAPLFQRVACSYERIIYGNETPTAEEQQDLALLAGEILKFLGGDRH